MTLSRKFIIALVSSILFIATINIVAFYLFYSSYLKLYFYEGSKQKQDITIEYINKIIEKQTIDQIDSVFSDTELEFFELLENNHGVISLSEEKNVNLVVNYLLKSGIEPKYIEEIIPSDNFKKVLSKLDDKGSPESVFVKRMLISILITNIIAIVFLIGMLLIFIKQTLNPIKKATTHIRNFNKQTKGTSGKSLQDYIEYKNKKDEIGLLVNAINNLNKKLNLQNDIRNKMLADISHELKTPITSIQCYLEGISDGVITLNEKNLESITGEMKRLIKLVNKIMDYEKLDRKKFTLHKEKINIVDLLKRLSETHKNRLSEKKQRIKVTGEGFLQVQADKDLLTQLIHNLVGNFIKYSGTETLLTINVTKKYIDFSDNGKGIKKSEIPFLMEKFYQGNVEKSGEIEKRGIGVGLALVGKIIESHNWKYQIKTDKEKGFSFKLYI